MKTCPPELLAAVSMAERLAELVEAGRQDDAYNEFFGRPFSDRYSAAHKAILAAYNEHVGETLGDHLEGLLASLMRLKQPHPKGPVNPVGIRSYCEDIRQHFGVANAAPLEPCQPRDAALPALTPEDLTILEALGQEHPMTVTLESLADVTNLSGHTVQDHTKYLAGAKLVNRPRGPKKGIGLTEAGLAILASRITAG